KADLLAVALKWAKKNEPNMTEEEVSVKLTRVLQKLSGKRGVLGTYRSGLRRGYHYGLKQWFYSSTGALRRTHLDKLVRTNQSVHCRRPAPRVGSMCRPAIGPVAPARGTRLSHLIWHTCVPTDTRTSNGRILRYGRESPCRKPGRSRKAPLVISGLPHGPT